MRFEQSCYIGLDSREVGMIMLPNLGAALLAVRVTQLHDDCNEDLKYYVDGRKDNENRNP